MFIMLVGIHPFDLEGDTSDVDILRRVANAKARTLTTHPQRRLVHKPTVAAILFTSLPSRELALQLHQITVWSSVILAD